MDDTATPDLPKVWVAPASRDGLALAVRTFEDAEGARRTPVQEQVIVTRWRPLSLDSSWHDELGRVWLTTGFSESANLGFLTVSLATFGTVRQEPIGPPITDPDPDPGPDPDPTTGFVAPAGWQLVNKADNDKPVNTLVIRDFVSYQLESFGGTAQHPTDGATVTGVSFFEYTTERGGTRDAAICTVLAGEQWGTPNGTWPIDTADDGDIWGSSEPDVQPRGWLWPATCAGVNCKVGIGMRAPGRVAAGVINPAGFRSGMGATVQGGQEWPSRRDGLQVTFDDRPEILWSVALFIFKADFDGSDPGQRPGFHNLVQRSFLIRDADARAGRIVPAYAKGSVIKIKSA